MFQALQIDVWNITKNLGHDQDTIGTIPDSTKGSLALFQRLLTLPRKSLALFWSHSGMVQF